MTIAFEHKVKQTIEKYGMLRQGDHVLVAVSGGADSLALLYVLHALQKGVCFSVTAAHVNHLLRSDAHADAQYVQAVCAGIGVPLRHTELDIPALVKQLGGSVEDVARQARYRYLFAVMQECKANKLAIGHHADDQAETVLLQLLRGAATEGLGGIRPIDQRGVIRPLIEVTRDRIEEYCKHQALMPRLDSTNSDTTYRRNRIRHELLPLLEGGYNHNVKAVLARTAALLRDENQCIEQMADEVYQQTVLAGDGRVEIDVQTLLTTHRALVRRVIRRAIAHVKGNLQDYAAVHIEDVLQLITGNKPSGRLNLPGNVAAWREYAKLIVYRNEDALQKTLTEAWQLPLAVPGDTRLERLGLTLRVECVNQYSPPTSKQICIGAHSVKLPLVVRNRRPGDRFWPAGVKGSQKLKQFFIDRKVPQHQRDLTPLIVDQEGILWVAGYRLSQRTKPEKENSQYIKITLLYDTGEEAE